MPLPSPTVEESPQPVYYNDPNINELRALPRLTSAERQATQDAMLNRCERCRGFFVLNEGYVFLDDFLCDNCYSHVAREAGFYGGR